jgi:hypothetical protein
MNRFNLNSIIPSWKNILVVSLILNTLLFSIFFLFMNPAFETGDDVGMMFTASGIRTGEPSEYLIYTNILIGKILKFMYMYVSSINWYSVYLYLTHFLAMLVICYSILRLNFRWMSILQYLFLFIFFEYTLLMNLQFTTTASLVALSGVCLLITSLQIKGKKAWFYVVLSALLFGSAGLIRVNVFYLILLLAVPFLLLKFRETKIVKIPVFLVLSFLLFTAFVQYNNNYYSKDLHWKEYTENRVSRSRLFDFPKFVYNERSKPVYTKIGWSENDFLVFKYGFNYDREVYSTEKLAFLDKNLRNQRNFKQTLKVLFNAMTSNGLLICVSLICLLLSMIYVPKKQRKFVYSIFFTAIIICIGLSYSARLPSRVFIPILLFVNAMTLFINSSFPVQLFNEIPLRKRVMMIATFFLLLFLLFPLHISKINNWSKTNQANNLLLKKDLEILSPGKDKLYVLWGANLFILQRTSPYSNLKEYRNLNLLSSGWMINSPLNEKMLARFGINNVFTSLNENSNIFLIMNKSQVFQNMLSRFMMEHYQQKIKFIIVSSQRDLGIVKILQVN